MKPLDLLPRFALISLLFSACALADTVTTFQSGVGSGPSAVCPSCVVNVGAVFTATGNGALTVKLSNFSDINKDGQVLTGVYFTYTGQGSVNTAVGQSTNELYNINSSNQLTNTQTTATKWTAAAVTSGTYNGYDILTNLNGGGCGGCQGIVGSGTGSSTNTNLANHNPYIEYAGTFTLTGLSGITADSTITSVFFNFGTAVGQTGTFTDITRTVHASATPEPGTIGLSLAAGAIAIFASRRKRAA